MRILLFIVMLSDFDNLAGSGVKRMDWVGLGFLGVYDEIVACCPVCDGVKIWLYNSFCCSVVWVGCCNCYVICIASDIEEMVVGYGNFR